MNGSTVISSTIVKLGEWFYIFQICIYANMLNDEDIFEIFKASALWADAFYKSKCPSVCPSVCLSVRSLLRYHLTVFLAPLPKVECPIFLGIRYPGGESNGKKWFEI